MIKSHKTAALTLVGSALMALAAPLLAQDKAASAEASPPAPVTYSSAFPVTAGEEAALDRIIADIGDKRVVALGEISHGDGSSFLFKARLIERLYRERGFDVLAMEGGIYDHIEAEERIAAGEQPSVAFARANYPVWTRSEQFAPMLDLVDEAASSGRPFTLVGVDFQHSGKQNEESIKRLSAIAERLGDAGKPVWSLIEIWRSISRVKEGPFRAFTAVLDQIDEARKEALNAIKEAGGPDQARDYRLINNHARFLRQSSLYRRVGLEAMGWGEVNMRDAMMGRNLNYEAITNYPDRKIVIWGATAHVMKERAAVDSEMPMIPMGQYIAKGPLADDYYVLAFSAFGGRNGTMRGDVYDIDPADPDGIESHAMSLAAQADTAFVEIPPCGEGRAKIRALGYQYYTGDWGCALDGVVVFRDMEPSILSQN
ncbi:MAG: erythromycin esterase family protein [Pseudomonadota bacterium]